MSEKCEHNLFSIELVDEKKQGNIIRLLCKSCAEQGYLDSNSCKIHNYLLIDALVCDKCYSKFYGSVCRNANGNEQHKLTEVQEWV